MNLALLIKVKVKDLPQTFLVLQKQIKRDSVKGLNVRWIPEQDSNSNVIEQTQGHYLQRRALLAVNTILASLAISFLITKLS